MSRDSKARDIINYKCLEKLVDVTELVVIKEGRKKRVIGK